MGVRGGQLDSGVHYVGGEGSWRRDSCDSHTWGKAGWRGGLVKGV